MENFVFYNPVKVIFGKNTIIRIGKEIKTRGIKRILLLAGAGSIKKNKVYDQVTSSLRAAGLEWTELWGVRPNPTLEHALEAIELVRKEKLEAVLSVGGGSVIDESKAVAAGYYLEDLWSAFLNKVEIRKALPVFSVLTLSGTCSEMDPYAVLSNDTAKVKTNIGAESLFPKVSIIDPTVQMTLPWNQTANGAIDAMSHIMEFYFLGTNEETVISINDSLLKTIIKSVDLLQKDEQDYNARANLAWAATLALNGIAGTAMKGGDWASHKIEHGISAIHPEVAHGAGLAVIFPAFIKYNQDTNPLQFKRWAKEVWGADTVDNGIDAMKSKFGNWKAPVSLRELGIKESEFDDIAESSLSDGLIGNLRQLGKREILEILSIAY